MASELRVNTLKDASGNNSVATSVVFNGSAKAWVNFNGTGTPAISDSTNVSSITDTATGQQTFGFSNAMGNVNYAPTACCTAGVYGASNIGSSGIGSEPTSKTTSQIRMHIGEGYDPADATTIIHGDLA